MLSNRFAVFASFFLIAFPRIKAYDSAMPNSQIDFILLIDLSSIGDEDIQKIGSLVQKLPSFFSSASSKTRVTLVSSPTAITSFVDEDEFIRYVEHSPKWLSTRRSTLNKNLKSIRKKMLARNQKSKVLLIIGGVCSEIDGLRNATAMRKEAKQARLIRDAGVQTYFVRVGKREGNCSHEAALAGSESRVFNADDFDSQIGISEKLESVNPSLCKMCYFGDSKFHTCFPLRRPTRGCQSAIIVSTEECTKEECLNECKNVWFKNEETCLKKICQEAKPEYDKDLCTTCTKCWNYRLWTMRQNATGTRPSVVGDTNPKSSDESGGLSKTQLWLLIGIGLGSLVLIIGLLIVALLVLRRKKRKRSRTTTTTISEGAKKIEIKPEAKAKGNSKEKSTKAKKSNSKAKSSWTSSTSSSSTSPPRVVKKVQYPRGPRQSSPFIAVIPAILKKSSKPRLKEPSKPPSVSSVHRYQNLE